MPHINRNGLDNWHFYTHSLDVTTSGADRCYAAFRSPIRGRLLRVKACCYNTVSGTADVITVKIGSTTVSGATFSFVSGIAAGACYQANATNSPLVQQGDIISFNSDGAGANETAPTTFMATIRKI